MLQACATQKGGKEGPTYAVEIFWLPRRLEVGTTTTGSSLRQRSLHWLPAERRFIWDDNNRFKPLTLQDNMNVTQ